MNFNQYSTLALRMSNGAVCKVTKSWWERFLDGEIKRLTGTSTIGLTSGPRGNGTDVHLEPREETGRRGSQNAAG